MIPSIFSFSNYKQFLTDWITAQPRRGHGIRIRLAGHLGCHTAYITQVLSGNAHFSLEQAEDLAIFLNLEESAAEYLHLLVLEARSGSARLKARARKRLAQIKRQQLSLKDRFVEKSALTEADQVQFFSRWYFPAVQMAATIPALRSRNSIMQALGINSQQVDEATKFLISRGFLRETKGALIPNLAKFFIGNDSPILQSHHTNWRLRAIQALENQALNDLHYTTLFSLAKKDAEKIRERLVREIAEARLTVKNSPEEELHAFCIDFFRLDQN